MKEFIVATMIMGLTGAVVIMGAYVHSSNVDLEACVKKLAATTAE